MANPNSVGRWWKPDPAGGCALGTSCADIVANGREAVSALAAIDYDIVLMDIDMPGLICFDAARTMMTTSPDSTR